MPAYAYDNRGAVPPATMRAMTLDVARVLDAAANAVDSTGRSRLLLLHRLPGNQRTVVLRARIVGPGTDPPGTVIVKAYAGGTPRPAGWARESAALGALSALNPSLTPRLLATASDPPLVVMEDLGGGPSLATALLGSDPAAAEVSLLGWAEAIAGLHGATVDSAATFQSAVGEPPDAEWPSTVEALRRSASELPALVSALGVGAPAGFADEVHYLAAALSPAAAAALSPADACPDNNVLVDGRVRLVDFEGAEFRHVAWDAAYLRVPWPSCWCSWRVPADVLGRALARYRARTAPALPYVGTAAFDADVTLATVAWTLISIGWLLPRGLTDDTPPADAAKVTPRRRALLPDRMATVVGLALPELPAVTTFAERCLTAMCREWPAPDRRLQLAPAFRG